MQIQDVIRILETHYRPQSAESWDNVGLLVGERHAAVHRILLSLELTDAILDEAIAKNCELIITHHPLIFKPLSKLNSDDPIAARILRLIRHNIALYSAHTNCDAAPHAIGTFLADSLGIQNSVPLEALSFNKGYKLIVYIPQQDTERVVGALHAAGAGCLGNYTEVSFCSEGVGAFTPSDAAHPAIGTQGKAEKVQENRVEMIVDSIHLKAVIKALLQAHPYEEPAFDLYALQNPDLHGITDTHGFGIIGDLPEVISLKELILRLKEAWNIDSLRFAGDLTQSIKRVAILNGSGAKFMDLARSRGAHVYITGDCGHHDFERANTLHFNLVDAGHFHTEKQIPMIFLHLLQKNIAKDSVSIEISENITCPYSNL